MSCPHLDGVVPEATDYLLLVILQAVHTFAVLTVALNTCQTVATVLPVVLHGLRRDGERERIIKRDMTREEVFFDCFDHSTPIIIPFNHL